MCNLDLHQIYSNSSNASIAYYTVQKRLSFFHSKEECPCIQPMLSYHVASLRDGLVQLYSLHSAIFHSKRNSIHKCRVTPVTNLKLIIELTTISRPHMYTGEGSCTVGLRDAHQCVNMMVTHSSLDNGF